MRIKFFLLFLVFAVSLPSFSQKLPPKFQGHNLKFKINGLKDTVAYLAGYYGPKQYFKDTADVDSQGNLVFKGKDSLPGGIYSVVMPDKGTYFEFIINEQNFSMETDTGNFVKAMKVKGSVENDLFYKRLNYLEGKQKEINPFKAIAEDSTKSEEAKKPSRDKLSAIDKEIKEYTLKVVQENPSTFLAKVFKAMEEPEVPETPLLPNGAKDSLFPFRYYKDHFFDNVDFRDDRLLRTPVFHNKMEKYLSKLTVQHPDSISAAADFMAAKAKGNKEMFKYIVHYVTSTYEKSNIMGMDAVFVHMAQNYYMKGEAFWIDTAQLAKITERANKLAPLLVGKKVVNVTLQDTSCKKWYSLYDVKAKYTVLIFWDPNCGHCKKVIPKLKELFDKYSDRNFFDVFAVGTEFEDKDWSKFIVEHNLNWTNVSDNPEINKNYAKYIHLTNIESLNFRQTFDIYATPVTLLLNENKEIIAKKIDVEQIEELLERFQKKEDKK